jgi:formylglycine-generating enzyme required for sulfatase activity
MSIDAMKQALEYTRPGAIVPVTPETVKILVDALRLAIEQAERQEPFVVKHYSGDERPIIKGNGFDGLEVGQDREEAQAFADWVNARLAPPQRQPLTEKEIEALARYEDKHGQGPWHLAFARAIERAHGIGGGE